MFSSALPPSGTTWTVPQPGLPASLASGLPPGVTTVGEPQITVLPGGEVSPYCYHRILLIPAIN